MCLRMTFSFESKFLVRLTCVLWSAIVMIILDFLSVPVLDGAQVYKQL